MDLPVTPLAAGDRVRATADFTGFVVDFATGKSGEPWVLVALDPPFQGPHPATGTVISTLVVHAATLERI